MPLYCPSYACGVVNVKSVNVTVVASNVIIIRYLIWFDIDESCYLCSYIYFRRLHNAYAYLSKIYLTRSTTVILPIRNRAIVVEWSYVILWCSSIVPSCGIWADWNISMNKHIGEVTLLKTLYRGYKWNCRLAIFENRMLTLQGLFCPKSRNLRRLCKLEVYNVFFFKCKAS